MALTDSRLAQLGKAYKRAKATENEAKEQASEISKKVVAELDRRGTKNVENNGVKVNRAQQERTTYNFAHFREHLTTKQLRSITADQIDPIKLAEQIQLGRIDPHVAAAGTQVTPTAAYITVTIKA